jgi:hypothetical protein
MFDSVLLLVAERLFLPLAVVYTAAILIALLFIREPGRHRRRPPRSGA